MTADLESTRQAARVADALNAMEGADGENFFLVVPDDHVPRKDWVP